MILWAVFLWCCGVLWLLNSSFSSSEGFPMLHLLFDDGPFICSYHLVDEGSLMTIMLYSSLHVKQNVIRKHSFDFFCQCFTLSYISDYSVSVSDSWPTRPYQERGVSYGMDLKFGPNNGWSLPYFLYHYYSSISCRHHKL